MSARENSQILDCCHTTPPAQGLSSDLAVFGRVNGFIDQLVAPGIQLDGTKTSVKQNYDRLVGQDPQMNLCFGSLSTYPVGPPSLHVWYTFNPAVKLKAQENEYRTSGGSKAQATTQQLSGKTTLPSDNGTVTNELALDSDNIKGQVTPPNRDLNTLRDVCAFNHCQINPGTGNFVLQKDTGHAKIGNQAVSFVVCRHNILN